MPQQKIAITQESNKPVEQLFAFLADHNNLSKVFGIPVRRKQDGQGEVNGVGSVRVLGFGPLATEETVTAVTPNRSIEYRITKGGGPIRNHSGRLDFSPTSRGSRVTWTIQFDGALPLVGPALKFVLGEGVRRGLKRVA